MADGYVRKAPLCWGQHWFWLLDSRPVRGDRPPLMLRIAYDPPTGLRLDLFRKCVSRLVARHEALRTVYRKGLDGRPTQLVIPPTEPPIAVVQIGHRPTESDQLFGHDIVEPVDISVRPAFRVAVGLTDECVSRVFLDVHMIAADGAAVSLLRAELAEIVHAELAGRQPNLPARVWQPVDQALAETADKLASMNQRALRYWARVQRDAPHSALPFYWSKSDPTLRTRMQSHVLLERCAAAMQKYRCSLPTLMQAMISVIIAGWNGQRRCAVNAAFSNQWSDDLRTSVGRYAPMSNIVVDMNGDPDFAEIVRCAHWTGYTGLTFNDFIGLATLRAVAAKLHVVAQPLPQDS